MSEQREPILTYKEAASWLDLEDRDGGSALYWIGRARDFYEAKLTSGELRVVKTIPQDQFLKHVMNDCPVDYDMLTFLDTGFHNILDYCPGCGAQIVEA